MIGAALRLLAAGQAGRRLGDYVKTLTARYLLLAVAAGVFLIAAIFGILAAFWALEAGMQNPIWAALILLGAFILAGLLITLIAYGTTKQKPIGAKQAFLSPAQSLTSQMPSVEQVGEQIELAVRRYGPLQVAAAAAAGGIVIGLLAKRFGVPPVYEPRQYGRRDDRRPTGYA